MLLTVLVLAAAATSPGPTPELSAERVRAAIEYGKSAKRPPAVFIRTTTGESCGTATTTFMQIALIAWSQAQKYHAITEADVLTSRIQRLRVHIPPLKRGGVQIESVQAIVVMPAGARAPENAIQPSSKEEESETFQNAFGAKAQASGMTATFPLSVIAAGNEIRVVLSGGQRCVLKINPVEFVQ